MTESGRAPDPRSDFAALITAVSDPVRRYLWRRTDAATADDVLAETTVVLWRRLAEVPAEPVPWAIGIARLQLANAERSARRRWLLHAKLQRLDPPRQAMPGPDVAGEEQEAVRRTLTQLAPADQELLRLSAWEELTAGEIAVVLGITPNAASIRLHRARNRFKAAWRKHPPAAGQTAMKTEEQR